MFLCEKCGVCENTALCFFNARSFSLYPFRYTEPALCSECDSRIGKWHGAFERQFPDGPRGVLVEWTPGRTEMSLLSDIWTPIPRNRGYIKVGDYKYVQEQIPHEVAAMMEPGTRAYRQHPSGCSIFVSRLPEQCDAGTPGEWHMSIAHPDRYPSWDEIKEARYALLPDDVTMALLLPPKGEYVNLHDNCFHLHQID